ncbi:hypothetical protein OAQ04_05160 [Flavobacteriaceae bacterium]|nr:hypothetical protein [Flavobacteriaceae bacterium]
MKPRTLVQILFFSILIGCTGIDLIDDYAPPVVRITTPVTSLTVGTNFQFEAVLNHALEQKDVSSN